MLVNHYAQTNKFLTNNTLRVKKVTSVLFMRWRVCSEILVAIYPAIWYYADKGNVPSTP